MALYIYFFPHLYYCICLRVPKNGNAETQWIIARKKLRTGLELMFPHPLGNHLQYITAIIQYMRAGANQQTGLFLANCSPRQGEQFTL